MGVADTKSTIVTNADASPRTMTPMYLKDGKVRCQAGTVETAAADDAGSVYRLCRVPSNARIKSLKIGHDDVTNMTTADVGVYRTAADGGAVVDVDLFATAKDISSASSGMVDITYQRSNARISDIEKPLWEQLGLSADPNVEYDICVTATTNDPTAAKTIALEVEFVTNA